jgi:serpin B
MKTFRHIGLLVLLLTVATVSESRANPALAADAINALGLDLLGKAAPADANALLSPYSIQTALAMTYAGAEGDTRKEMARVLHYPMEDTPLHRSFAELQAMLDAFTKTMAVREKTAPVTLAVANRLYGQTGYPFRSSYLDFVKTNYGAPLQQVDFKSDARKVTSDINQWVADRTSQRIRDLMGPRDLDESSRLVLANAVYFKAPWSQRFQEHGTRPLAFHARGGAAVNVPTMFQQSYLGYSQQDGFKSVVLPYSGRDLQFLILLPDEVNGLTALEKKLTPELLKACGTSPSVEILLYLPKFKLEPPTMRLGDQLQALGMKTAFNQPSGSANFERLSPRKPDDYLFISQVLHKTFLSLDEQGTEAAAATAVIMAAPTAVPVQKPMPVEVRVDHPFVFAIQHRPSGACLFLGRMNDPR